MAARQVYTSADLIEDVEWLIGTDASSSIARRLGFANVGNLRRSLYRLGRDDLAQRLHYGGSK